MTLMDQSVDPNDGLSRPNPATRKWDLRGMSPEPVSLTGIARLRLPHIFSGHLLSGSKRLGKSRPGVWWDTALNAYKCAAWQLDVDRSRWSCNRHDFRLRCGLSSVVTVTGRSLVPARLPAQWAPLPYSCRHWKTWLAFTPCSLATRAIDAPDASVASTIRRFSSGVRNNRFREPPFTPAPAVSPIKASSTGSNKLSIRRDPDAYDNSMQRRSGNDAVRAHAQDTPI